MRIDEPPVLPVIRCQQCGGKVVDRVTWFFSQQSGNMEVVVECHGAIDSMVFTDLESMSQALIDDMIAAGGTAFAGSSGKILRAPEPVLPSPEAISGNKELRRS